jgi:Tol biopolymer transport system component
VYQRGQSAVQLSLVHALGPGRPLLPERRVFAHPRLSPDGRRVAVAVRGARGADIWLYSLADGTSSRLTQEGDNDFPEWSPDGTRVVFRSTGRGGTTVRWARADGSGEAGVLVPSEHRPYDAVFTPDARALLFRTADGRSIMEVRLDSAGRPVGAPRPVVTSQFIHASPRVSPDGRWLAYLSDETGRLETYVRAYPGPGPRVQVSAGGGSEPVWSRDGATLYYRGAARTLVAARLQTGTSVTVADRRTIAVGTFLPEPSHANYDVARDGERFLVLQPTADEAQTVVVLGWAHELHARLTN